MEIIKIITLALILIVAILIAKAITHLKGLLSELISINNHLEKKKQRKFNLKKWHLAINYLSTTFSRLSYNTKDLISSGKCCVKTSTLVVRQKATEMHITNMLYGYNYKIKGKNDFDGNILNRRNFIFDSITVNYGIGKYRDTAQSINYSSPLPEALKSSNIVIKQDDNIICRLSVSAIDKAKAYKNGYFLLDNFELIQEYLQTSIHFELGLGKGIIHKRGEYGFIEVIFKGFEIK